MRRVSDGGNEAREAMASPLLATKLRAPTRRRGVVSRARLSDRLDRGGEAALTLVSAPAGFGKTTLLTEWLAARTGDTRSTAWLSLDRRDNDPIVFWNYVLAALQTAGHSVGAGAAALLHSPQVSVTDMLAILVNDLDAITDDLTLVLDDYHVIEAREVHDAISFLLEHAPPQIHLVIATRADPPLALARMRARGELVELRADELRFTAEEAADYLNEVMGLALTPRDLAVLEERTEGWIAALQLAALSMQGRRDTAGFIDGFAGDDRHIVDYLLEEVLLRQPDEVRNFLLQTSILTRLNASLCDAIVGRSGSQAMLADLDRANLFLVQLDDRRHWYRYHHLFADMLRARLLDEQPGRIAELHRRASRWHADDGDAGEAIRHALAGGEPAAAAELVERVMPEMRRERRESTLRSWLEALPDEVLRNRPVLCTAYAGVLLMHGETDGVEKRLRDAEMWLDGVTETGGAASSAADRERDASVRSVRSEVALYRAALARVTGDLSGTMNHARRVFDLAGQGDRLLRGAAAGLLGLAHWSRGELDTAHRWWSDSRANLQEAGHHADTLGVAIALADIRRAQGRLRAAIATYEQGLADASAHGSPALRGAADMHVGLSELLLELDDTTAARQHLAASAQLGEHAGLPQNRHRWRIATARLRQVEGELADAVDLLDEAERLYVGDMFPEVRPIAAIRARAWLAQGRVNEALAWARERGLSVEDEPSYLREYEQITLARILLARHTAAGDSDALDNATRLLERLLTAAEDGERTGSVIELLALRALARQVRGDRRGALDSLSQAVTLAEPEGYVRVFVDEGTKMASLLKDLSGHGTTSAYISRLLASTGGRAPVQMGLVEPLSGRELEVLRLLATELDGPGIARELVVSLNTVRSHTKNIYAKLGVNNRRAAVRRAAELNLRAAGHPR